MDEDSQAQLQQACNTTLKALANGLLDAIDPDKLSGKTAADILDLDVDAVFAEIGLQEHLSPSRRNGLEAMLEKIRYYAKNLG